MSKKTTFESSTEALFTKCSTEGCPLWMLCERKHRQDVIDQTVTSFQADANGQYIPTERCDWYIPREALSSEKKVFRPGGRKGMKSNRHVMPHQRTRVTPEDLGLKKPDLMVSRHIKMGIDINKEKDGK